MRDSISTAGSPLGTACSVSSSDCFGASCASCASFSFADRSAEPTREGTPEKLLVRRLAGTRIHFSPSILETKTTSHLRVLSRLPMTRWCEYLSRAYFAFFTRMEGSVSSLKLTMMPSGAQPSTSCFRNLGTGSRSMTSLRPSVRAAGASWAKSAAGFWWANSSLDCILCSTMR